MNLTGGIARAFSLLALSGLCNACRVATADGAPAPTATEVPRSTKAASAPDPSAPDPAPPVAVPLTVAPPSAALADVSGPPPDARREACGSVSRLLAPGSGADRPRDDDRVLLEYATFARSGQPLDSSATRGEPIAESVRNLAAGVPCVVKRMRVGESRRVWLPRTLQLADQEEPRSVAAVDRTIDITLRKLTRAPAPPADYASPPRAAQHTATGLRFQVLQRGTEGKRPVGNSRVTIYHSGWTNRGALFESSVLTGQPASYLAYELPTGLSEGIQLMHVGDKMRFWLPERLAYAGAHRSAPKGPVVFDVELLAID
jgi:FKBP-type peptidyl-prolyl cis-trans isomerase